jgi:hypothetical protein
VVKDGGAQDGGKNAMTCDFNGGNQALVDGGLPKKSLFFFEFFILLSLLSVSHLVTLGKDPFTDQKFTVCSLPSVTLDKDFIECQTHSAKPLCT